MMLQGATFHFIAITWHICHDQPNMATTHYQQQQQQ